MTSKRIDFLGFPLDVGVSPEAVCGLIRAKGQLRMITFINPGAWALSKKRPEYIGLLKDMSLVLPDGFGVAAACERLTGEECPRLSFDMSSLAGPFFDEAIAVKATVMLVGGKPGVDEEVHGKMITNMPNLKIIGTQHGYGSFETKIALIMAKKPDVVIVGMGAPRQESFLSALRDAGYKGMAITCGGFFDQYLLADPYYPAWVDKWNLRFAYRLYMEPGRLWRRYLIDYPVFIFAVLRGFSNKSNRAFKNSSVS